MFIRITQSVNDYGNIIKPDELESWIDDFEKDWYVSPFYYGDDALEYFQNNIVKDKNGNEHNSIKGYNGDVWTQSLYWDLDHEDDIQVAIDATKSLIATLEDLELEDGVEIYYSGNKGFHVFLRTQNTFSRDETKRICYNIAYEAGLIQLNKEYGAKIYDPTVYNVNRIFRVVNTKHQKSGNYKIQLEYDDLEEGINHILSLAKERQQTWSEGPVEAEFLKEKYKKQSKPNLEVVDNVVDIEKVKSSYGGNFNPLDCPPDKRRCIYVLENGYFGPGERENASIRLAAYYNGIGWAREQVFEKIKDALLKREQIYEDLNPWSEEDIWRVVDEVFDDNWQGGMYSCKTDEFLQSKCDVGNGPCAEDQYHKRLNVVTIGGLIDQYIQYGMEALEDYPKTGLGWLDSMVRFRPRNYSIINGANGSGKTSFLIQWIEHLNSQKMYHVIFSADMADTSLFEKIGARHTQYSQRDIETAFNKHTAHKEVQEEVIQALKTHYPYTIFDFTSALTPKHIESTLRNLKDAGYCPQIAFIDYAGRVIGEHDNQYQNATEIALESNDIAKRTSTHLCFVSQVPREQGDHTTPLRNSRVSKDSGSWEENATIVINMWRPFGNGIEVDDNYIHLYVAKNRSGALGEHVFWWEGKTGEIRAISEAEFETYKNLCLEYKRETPIDQFQYRDKDIDKLIETGKFKPKNEPEEEDDEDEGMDGGRSKVSNNRERKRSRRSSRFSD